MPPYRVHSDDDSLHIVVLPTTFWVRFRASLRASRMGIAWAVGWGALLAVGVASLGLVMHAAADLDDESPWTLLGAVFLGAWLVFGGFPLTLLVVRLISASRKSSPLEQFLPSAITMRDDGLVVTDRSGTSQAVEWSWLAGARDLGDSIELSLAHDKPVLLFLRPEDGVDLARVRRWLVKQELLAEADPSSQK